MQPQPAEHLAADHRPDPDAPGDWEPDLSGDHRHGGTRPHLPLPSVVGRPEHRGPGFVHPLHPLLQVRSLRAEARQLQLGLESRARRVKLNHLFSRVRVNADVCPWETFHVSAHTPALFFPMLKIWNWFTLRRVKPLKMLLGFCPGALCLLWLFLSVLSGLCHFPICCCPTRNWLLWRLVCGLYQWKQAYKEFV